MKILDILVLFSMVRNGIPRRHKSSSGESIENFLYYKDCKHTTVPTTTSMDPIKLRAPMPPEPSCPFPKMCCAMSCNNEPCVSEQLNNFGRNWQPNNIEPMSGMPGPNFHQKFKQNPLQRVKKKKFKPPPGMGPMGGRREFGFTKERIKSLISNDDDIRKILKDLVRVTMQKVDLQQMINNRRSGVVEPPINTVTTIKPDSNAEYDDD